MTLKPLKNIVMFTFLDETGGAKGAFSAALAESGIILPASVSLQKTHRWGRVVAAGPEAEVVEGDLILVEALMWMEGVKFDGRKVWKTDDSKILAVTDDISACEQQF